MAKEVKKEKKKKKNPKKLKAFFTFLFVTVMVFLVTITAAQKLGNLTLSAIATDVKAYFMSFFAGDGYPYKIDATKVKDIQINNSNLFMLLDDKTTILTSKAKEIMPQEHTYSNPVMKLKGSKAIIYDLNSGKYRIQSGSDIIAEFEEANNIMCGAISKNGNYAIGTYSDECQSVFKAYTKNRKEQYVYNFKSERIISISLSDNGKYAAVAVVGGSNGSLYSELYIFEFSKTEPLKVFEYTNSTIIEVDYVKKTNIAVICDNMHSYIKDNSLRQDDTSFDSGALCCYDVSSSGKSAVVLSKFGSTSLSTMKIYSSDNNTEYSVDFDSSVKWVSTDGKYTAVLFGNSVKTFNDKGEQVGEIYFDGEPIRVQVDSNKTYVLTSVELKCYKTKGTTNERVTKSE